jgi:hypothetical protein
MRLVAIVNAILLASAAAGCVNSPAPSSSERPFPNAVLPGATRGPGPDVDCSRLLTKEEVEAAVGVEVAPYGWNLNSCYWSTSTGIVQIVLMTGPGAGAWFSKLTESGLGQQGMEPVDGYDFEALAKPGSFGGFVPGRAALVHGIADREAAGRLIRLVLTRL